jgi:hypothetical protein
MGFSRLLLLGCALLGIAAAARAQCYDKQPPSDSCALHKKWGNCYEPWMIQGNYCAATCRRCGGPKKDDVWKPEPKKEDIWKPEPKKDDIWKQDKAKCYVNGNYYSHGLYVKCPTCAYNYCQCCDGTWLNCRNYLTGKEEPWC